MWEEIHDEAEAKTTLITEETMVACVAIVKKGGWKQKRHILIPIKNKEVTNSL
jgi:hypothetical protein